MQRVFTLISLVVFAFSVCGLAACGKGASSLSAPVNSSSNQPPSAPIGLSASAENNQVSLTWSAVSGGSSYNVYRGASSGALSTKTKITSIVISPNYTDTTALNGNTYYYQVTAVNSSGESAGSNEMSATPNSSTRLMGGSVQGNSLNLTGTKTTFTSGLSWPMGITTDGTNLYVTNNTGVIDKIVISNGALSTLATVSAWPGSMTTDGTNLYVTNINDGTVSKIVISTGAVSTLASGFSFSWGGGITTDGTNLYVGNGSSIGSGKVSKIVISTGAVSTLATGFGYPSAITTDGTNLYLVDNNTGDINKIVIATGAVSTLATGFSSASMAGITTDGPNLYVTSGVTSSGSTLRKIVISTGSVSPVTTFTTSTADLTTDGASLYFAGPGSGDVFKVD